ncbi:hypothetical protein BST44_27975 [Mycobacterium scrofulaceum]|uniref:Uncharacterized protein n=1 Tax=Mycobacterium scrofulaceum TaxID=1783 RepID=A0A1X0JUR0_MYCSC|nr:hypothetical protein BST44_27975 [Mycobacterium scrofulaceum]ORV19723.1 hypothetical protein AWB97_25350 [Mycobacterium intracellulare subsp. chimaera]
MPFGAVGVQVSTVVEVVECGVDGALLQVGIVRVEQRGIARRALETGPLSGVEMAGSRLAHRCGHERTG